MYHDLLEFCLLVLLYVFIPIGYLFVIVVLRFAKKKDFEMYDWAE